MSTLRTCLLGVVLGVTVLGWGPAFALGLESRILGSTLTESNPRNVLTATFEVTNTTNAYMECLPRIELPSGWKLVTPQIPLGLERNQTSVFLLSFFIPADAKADTYTVKCIFTAVHVPSISSVQTLTVKVLPVTGVNVRLIEAPRTVVAGQPYTASFLVTNLSNQMQHIRARITSTHDFPFTADTLDLTLDPAGSQVLTVAVRTSEDISAGFTHRLACTVAILDKPELSAEAHALVEIIPVRAAEIDRYQRVPTTLRIRQALEIQGDTTTSLQAELAGSGTLNKDGTRHIEFLIRGPDTLDKSSFGSRDNYYLKTWSEACDLTLGDTAFTLSDLTEQYLAARGAAGRITYHKASLSSYHAQTRGDTPQTTETAAALGYAITDNARITVNGLNKDIEGSAETDELLTASAHLKPHPTLDILLEGGAGKHQDDDDYAYLLNLAYQNERFFSRIRYLYAGPDFPGYYQNKTLCAFDIASPLSASLQLNASGEREVDNLDQEETQTRGAYNTWLQTGLSYRPTIDTTYTATWQYRALKDRMDPRTYDYAMQTLRAGVLRNFTKLSVNLSGECGLKTDRLANEHLFVYKTTSSLYFRLTEEQSYGGFLGFAQGEESETGNDRDISAGLTGAIIIRKKTQVQLAAQTDVYPDYRPGNRYTVNASIGHTFPHAGTLTLRAMQNWYADHTSNTDETSLLLEYSYPFGLPVGRKKEMQTVSGTVRDALTGSPLANVVVRLNDMKSATDRSGRFTFSGVIPQGSYLNIDASKLGFDQIPTCQNPLPLKLKDRESTLDITLTKKAVLTGRIILHVTGAEARSPSNTLSGGKEEAIFHASPSLEQTDTGLANVLIELTNEQETLRVLTDTRGRFRFDSVRPGTWTLLINTDSLPPHHILDTNNIAVTLGPGQAQDITIQAVPKQRTIRMLPQDDMIIEETPRR